MKSYFLFSLVCLAVATSVNAKTSNSHAIYVDSNIGDDKNPGTKESPVYSIDYASEIIRSKDNSVYTMKINPGIYVLDSHVSVSTEKDMTGKRIVIEASVLPDDPSWTPEKMPIIKTKSQKGEIMEKDLFIKDKWITSFYINDSHITIRGLKFLGYDYPASFYYPITRFNKEKTDLIVEQCMFLGDSQTSVIQGGVIAHGDAVKIDHCVFYNVNNAAIYWQDSGNNIKTGNSMTNCIVYGAHTSAIWTASPDKDFIFKDNIITNCNFFWVKEASNTAKYSLDSCVIVNNQNYKGDGYLNPSDFELTETNVIKQGNILLRMINTVFEPWPVDHLHIMPNTLGYNIGAGIFKHRKQ